MVSFFTYIVITAVAAASPTTSENHQRQPDLIKPIRLKSHSHWQHQQHAVKQAPKQHYESLQHIASEIQRDKYRHRVSDGFRPGLGGGTGPL